MSDPALYRPTAAPDRSGDSALARIERISQNARTTWFGLLALMAFIGVTLMAHEDSVFFARDVRTQLPLVGVSVKPYAFFIASPLILAAVYAYLHLYLITLWDALADAPSRPGGAPLSERIFPWLLGQSAVLLRDWLRGDGSARRPALWLVTLVVSFVLTWVAGLLLLGRLWTESWAVHDEHLSLWIAACLCVAGLIGTRTGALLLVRMRGTDRKTAHGFPFWMIGTTVLAIPLLAVVTSEKTVRGKIYKLARADLFEAQLTPRPKDWKPFAIWLEDYRKENTPDTLDQDPMIPTRDEIARWRLVTQALDAPVLESRDLRDADVASAFLPGADLRSAKMQGTLLLLAELQGADLSGAEMKDADLSGAQMQGAVLLSAEIRDSECTSAAFTAALVHSADLTCRDGTLDESQLRLTVGDRKTILPDGLWVWTCLPRDDPDIVSPDDLPTIEGVLKHHPEKGFFRISRARFKDALFCDDDENPLRINGDKTFP